MAVSLIIGMNDDDSTSADQFWSSCGYRDFLAILSRPSNINQSRHALETLNFRVSNRCSFYWIVNIRPHIFNNITSFEEVDEN